MHTPRLTALCPGPPGWARTRKVKTIWILLKQETVSGSGISWAICKSAPSSRHHASTPPLSFLQAGCPSCRPTNSVKALKASTEGITHCLRLNLQLHTVDLVMTCRISSFCAVAWQLARFQLTRRIAWSLGDSGASCCNTFDDNNRSVSSGFVRFRGKGLPYTFYAVSCDTRTAY